MSDGTIGDDGSDDCAETSAAWVDAFVAEVRAELERDIFADPLPEPSDPTPAKVPKGRRKRVEPKSRVLKIRELNAARSRAMPLFDTVRDLPPRPRLRAECEAVERPCPWVGCAYNLYLDVGPSGSIKLNFPDRDPDEMTASCALDVAETGGMTLDDVGALINVTRERARQTEAIALSKVMAEIVRDRELFEHVEVEHRRRSLPLYDEHEIERIEARHRAEDEDAEDEDDATRGM